MIGVSRQWKEQLGCYQIPNRQRLVPLSDIKITADLADKESQEDIDLSSSSQMSWSTIDDVKDISFQYIDKVATLEPNFWLLDGSFNLVDEDEYDQGYVSNTISGSDNTFTDTTGLTLTFSEVHTKLVDGMTIKWSSLYDEYAVNATVKIYNNNVLVTQKNLVGNAQNTSVIEGEYSGYNRIDIEVTKWSLPYRRARIETVLIGRQLIFGKDDLFSYSHEQSGDLLSFELPDARIKFELDNKDGKWNPDNLKSIYRYLLERQRLNVQYGYKIGDEMEYHTFGTLYLNGWQVPQNGISASFEACSLLDFMNITYIQPTTGTYTLYQIITQAFAQSELPTNDDGSDKWHIDESLKDFYITFPFENDTDYTCSQVVQYCANAGRAIIRIDELGDIWIEPLNTVESDYVIDQFNSFQNGEYDIQKQLKSIVINDEFEYDCSRNGEVQKIDNPFIQNEDIDYFINMKDILDKRRLISGEYRCDPRIQVFDIFTNENKYALNTAYITDINYSYSGCFRGSYKGRVIKTISKADREGYKYSGDAITNDEY